MSPIGDWYERPDGKWVYDEGAPKADPSVTGMLPTIRPREVEALHGVEPRSWVPDGDVGDWIDPDAPDPTADEVTDPDDPSYVLPWRPR